MKMDEKDIQILKHLLTDSRQSARKLSLRMGVSTVTMISRMKKLLYILVQDIIRVKNSLFQISILRIISILKIVNKSM